MSATKFRCYCPHCGQIVKTERCGVILSGAEAKIFDKIESAPGITVTELADFFGIRRRSIITHVNHIRSKIAGKQQLISHLGYFLKAVEKK